MVEPCSYIHLHSPSLYQFSLSLTFAILGIKQAQKAISRPILLFEIEHDQLNLSAFYPDLKSALSVRLLPTIPECFATKKMRKSKKNKNQTDLFELLAHLEQLEQIDSELKMIAALDQSELSTIVEKQIDWVELDQN